MSIEIPVALARSHWEMMDSLATEVLYRRRNEMPLGKVCLWDLFKLVYRDDPRFNAVGVTYSLKGGCMLYTTPEGVVYRGEHAAAAFLALGMKSPTTSVTHKGEVVEHNTKATEGALGTLHRQFSTMADLQEYVRWQCQKFRGFKDRSKDLFKGYEPSKVPDFPDTLSIINELYPKKD